VHRYLAKFDFRYNNRDMNDATRAAKALKGVKGSASPIDGLAKPRMLKLNARAFIHWRKTRKR
jgi:hypothetical protein